MGTTQIVTVLAALLVLGARYISPPWKDLIVYVLLVLILIARPGGLLGERCAERL